MTRPDSKDSLELLDRSDLDLSELIDHAASVLRVDLVEETRKHLEHPDEESSATGFTFHEQWILRWLLKRFTSEQTPHTNSHNAEIPSRKPWMLLLHLLYAIPQRVSAEILAERKFLQRLAHRLTFSLKTSSAFSGATSGQANGYGVVVTAEERPRKRRRVSSEPESPRSPADRALHDVVGVVFRVCCRFADIIASQPAIGKHNEHIAGIAWTTSVQDNAMAFAASLQVALAYVMSPSANRRDSASFSQMQKLLALWDSRPVAVSDVAKANEVAAFNVSCLAPCLELLDFCTRLSKTYKHVKDCAQRLEKLLAIHTILPLRTGFNDRQSKQWKRSRICVNWSDIEPLYIDMAATLVLQSRPSDGQTGGMFDVGWTAWSLHLYSIAVRLIPKSDHRRKQWEQPWLDALFACLCYFSLPALPKLSSEIPHIIRPLENVPRAGDEHGLLAVNGLVRVVLEQHTNVSLQLLSYVASAVLSQDTGHDRWKLLSNMVSLDVNILIPGLGVPTTDYAINKLREDLRGQFCSYSEYSTLRDGIMLPLISGFARTRALRNFTEMWRTELTIAMELGPLEGGNCHAMMIWEDEDVFDSVGEMAKQHATPALTQEVFTRTLENLLELDSFPAATESIADAAICTAFLEAREISGTDSSKVAQIQNAALISLKQRICHRDHRWRLWKLIHCIQEKRNQPHLAADMLALTDHNGKDLSLQALEVPGSATILRPSQLRERLERFSILTQQASKGNKPFYGALKSDIDALRGFISTSPQNGWLWNGRTTALNCPDKLISACLGVMLSRPEVLQVYPDLALRLLHKLESGSSQESHSDGATQVTLCVSNLVHNLIASVQANGTKKVSDEANLTMLEATAKPRTDGAQLEQVGSLHIESMSKSRLRTMASGMFERLLASNDDMSLSRLAENLALMDRLGALRSVSFCQGNTWSHWVEILRSLEKRDFEDELSHFSMVRRCITSLLRKVVISLVDEAVMIGSDVLSPVLKWCKAMIRETSPIKLGMSRFLALQTCMSVLCGALDNLAESVSKSFGKLGREYVRRLSDAVITILNGGSELSQTDYWVVNGLLHALSEVETISPAPEELVNLIQSCELVCRNSIASHSDDQGGFPEHSVASLALFRRYLNHWTPKRKESPLSKVAMKGSLAYPNSWNEKADQQQLVLIATRANNLVETLDLESQADLLDLMAQDSHNATSGPLAPCMVAAIILQIDASRLLGSPRLVQLLADVASAAGCSRLADQTRTLLALENTKLVLELHPRMINQATIDSLLSNMSLLLAPSSNLKLHTANGDATFDRIIAIVGSLLSRFRRRLSDRHHLLLPILQQLLRCLFYAGPSSQHFLRQPAQGSNPVAFLKTLPPWLRSSNHPLSASCAEKYTRIICSICNPTASAAKSSSSRKRTSAANELNDETKRVKTLASEHMQYLVMEYCRCTLDGESNPQVKGKLMPGMYTLLESMSRDLMMAMNAAMDPSSRAIFKGLYNDWVRYGKWDRS